MKIVEEARQNKVKLCWGFCGAAVALMSSFFGPEEGGNALRPN
jgi:hypothetical protein